MGVPLAQEHPRSTRSKTAGVMMIGLGFAFIFLLSFTVGEPGIGIGIGGAFALIGAAFFVNALMLNRSQPYSPRPPAVPPRQAPKVDPTDPPSTFTS